jgi:uncharacterized RDD family membrane protein YckC
VMFAWLAGAETLLGNDTYRQTLWIWILGIVLYFPLTEGLLGWSVGKLVTKTRVVRADGSLPGVGKAAIRTVLRLIEVNPLLLGGLPAAIAVVSSEKRQRLGDMVAQTYVLKTSDVIALSVPTTTPYSR